MLQKHNDLRSWGSSNLNLDANKDRIIIASVNKPKDNEDTNDVKKKVYKGIKM